MTDPVRERAIQQVRRKRGLQAHVLSFVLVTLVLIAVWLIWLPTIFFWPLTGLLPWIIGLVFHVWAVYNPSDLDEARVEREMDRLHHRRSAQG